MGGGVFVYVLFSRFLLFLLLPLLFFWVCVSGISLTYNLQWGDIRGFKNLKEVVLVVKEGSDDANPEKERLMPFYARSLRRVWDAYIEGNCEGVEGEGDLWVVPKIKVLDAVRKLEWGVVELKLDE